MANKPQPELTTHNTRITSWREDGCGVGENGAVLPFSLPGEDVEYDVLHYKRHKRVHRVAVKQESPKRINPRCPHFTQHHPTHCGGCMLQHMSDESVADFKMWKVLTALNKEGLTKEVLGEACVQPILTAGYGKRRRTNMEAILKPDGPREGACDEAHGEASGGEHSDPSHKENYKVHLGFHRFQSHAIVDLHECHTLLPSLVALLEPMKLWLRNMLEPFQKVQLFILQAEHTIDMVFAIQGVVELSSEQIQHTQQFANSQNIRVTWKHGKKRLLITEPSGPATLTWGGVPVPVSADCFVQPTQESDAMLAQHTVMAAPYKHVADLFCGRGTLGLSAVANGHTVEGFEFDKSAVEALENTGALANVQYRNLFDQPLSADELNRFDAVIINPPRAGALAQIKELARSTVRYGVYVSCNPETAARDLAIWVAEGHFRIKSIQPIDQFAGSPHVELVAHLEACI